MRQIIIYSIMCIIALFIGIKIGGKATDNKVIREFEYLRHQNIATEIDLQVKLLHSISEGKYNDAENMLAKWLEQNVCEMGVYKQSKYFTPSADAPESISNAKKYIKNRKLTIGDCSKSTFSIYSGLPVQK